MVFSVINLILMAAFHSVLYLGKYSNPISLNYSRYFNA
ncbi:hypothetical protein Xinn_03960 [Xenorhabdus innexi]|uniref:Uncharacterized protein n=1 Tax=Xenorhabdus innexi TaxID=290109 RepID=A0A2G0MYN5_9GAMM|nr:hypothetical protein Xinn_03960 [Xenorhabdus innexi]